MMSFSLMVLAALSSTAFASPFPDFSERLDANELAVRQEAASGWEGSSYECIQTKHEGFKWYPADAAAVRDGWNQLYTQEDQPVIGAGPAAVTNECQRVSCSGSSGIYVCNDNDHEITLPSWAHVAGGALELCTLCSAAGQRDVCGGQLFHKDGGYNILIAEDLTC